MTAMLRDASLDLYQDAWGVDDDDGSSRPVAGTPAPKQQQQQQQQQQQRPKLRLEPAAGPSRRGPPSLYATCLGVLAEHLEEVLHPACAPHVLPLLPAESKACLLAVARLRRLLSDATLLLLVDQGQSIIDLHGCGHLLSDAGICAAIQRMPDLRLADLSSCSVGSGTLSALGMDCPRLEVLRLGSAVTDCASAARGLKSVLPVLEQRQQAPAADSWDALCEVDEQALAVAVAGGGRLLQLRCIHWPNMPHRLAQYCRTACPKVALNPSSEQVVALQVPQTCDPLLQYDAVLLAEVAGSQRWEQREAEPQAEPIVHIAEKFRLAFESQRQRLQAKAARSWQQQRRRQMRCSPTEAAIAAWEATCEM